MKKALVLLISTQLLFSCGNDKKAENNNNTNIVVETTPKNRHADIKESQASKHNLDSTVNKTVLEVVKNNEITTETNTSPEEVIEISNNKEELISKVDSAIAKPIEKAPEVVKVIFKHQKWDALVRKYVSSTGKVNYKGFLTDKSDLNIYLNELKTEYTNLNSWSKNKQLAYWINLYNAFTVSLILEHYPTSSIKNINAGKPWDKRFIKLGDKSYTLNEVENEIIRKRYNESRIHFAVNCAAKSCPKLMNRAFTESNLNSKLTEMTVSFLKDTNNNVLSAKKVQVSKIFEWYKSDFTKNGDIIPYLRKYSNVEINNNAKVEYLEYNWDLNE